MRSFIRRLSSASGIAVLALGAGMSSAEGADALDFTLDFPAGVACAGFDLRVEGRGGKKHYKEFLDANGNVVRTLTAGTGAELTFINLSTHETLTLKSNGFANHSTVSGDGTVTSISTGHVVNIQFPTDVPAGPSTTLYVGRTVVTIDSAQVYTLESVRGTSTDLCAALTS